MEELSGRGGVETVLDLIRDEIASRGHQVTFYLPIPTANPEWNSKIGDITWYYDPVVLNADAQQMPVSLRRITGLRRLLEINGLGDVLIATHLPATALYARMGAGESPQAPPVVSWLHNPAGTFYNPQWINYADLHWAISNGLAQDTARYLSPSRLIYWVGNPVSGTERTIPLSQTPRFLFIGRLENRQKRLDILLKALSDVSFDFHLDLYGDGPDRDMLQALADKLGLAGRCTWHGWVANPWEHVAEASCLLITSDFEAFAMVIGEALAHGVPVISSDCDFGPRELIQEGQNGALFPPGDWRALVGRLEDAVDQDRFRAWGRAAPASVAKYGAASVVDRMLHALGYYIRVE